MYAEDVTSSLARNVYHEMVSMTITGSVTGRGQNIEEFVLTAGGTAANLRNHKHVVLRAHLRYLHPVVWTFLQHYRPDRPAGRSGGTAGPQCIIGTRIHGRQARR